MAAKSHQRGWVIIYIDGRWVYEDTGEPVEVERPCRRCNQMPTPEGYDACLGYVPGATSVCCGHGLEPAYTVPALKMKCWHCNEEVYILTDGWICPSCGQHGPSFNKPASTFKEGCIQNAPYTEQSCQA